MRQMSNWRGSHLLPQSASVLSGNSHHLECQTLEQNMDSGLFSSVTLLLLT